MQRRGTLRLARLKELLPSLPLTSSEKEKLLNPNTVQIRLKLKKNSILELSNKKSHLITHIGLPKKIKLHQSLTTTLDKMGVYTYGHNIGYTGQGVTIFHTEGDGIANVNDSRLADTNIINFPGGDQIVTEHATNTLSLFHITAPGSQLIIGSTDAVSTPSAACFTRTDLLASYPIDLMTVSVGYGGSVYEYCDQVWDNYSYQNGVSMFSSSGNDASLMVTSPSKSYNGFSVGAYNNSISPYAMEPSSYINPLTKAEKPDFVAPGSNIDGYTGWGTSYSTPIAAGVAAMRLQESAGFKGQPALLKSFMLATTISDIDNDGKVLSAKDGAGAVGMSPNYWNWRSWNENVPATSYSFSEPMTAGKKYRIAISWLVSGDTMKQRVDSGILAEELLPVDYDLSVYNGITQVALSSSSTDNKEMVEFTAPTSGNYTVIINRKAYRTTTKLYLGYTRYIVN